MTRLTELPDTPDWQPETKQARDLCTYCGSGQRFCGLMIEWQRVKCCDRCAGHDEQPATLTYEGDQA